MLSWNGRSLRKAKGRTIDGKRNTVENKVINKKHKQTTTTVGGRYKTKHQGAGDTIKPTTGPNEKKY